MDLNVASIQVFVEGCYYPLSYIQSTLEPHVQQRQSYEEMNITREGRSLCRQENLKSNSEEKVSRSAATYLEPSALEVTAFQFLDSSKISSVHVSPRSDDIYNRPPISTAAL